MREKLTYANVMVTILAFLVLGGAGAYAAARIGPNTVGTAQLKNNAVTTKKIRNGAVTGSKVNVDSLGRVPSAKLSDNATNAGHATSADSATHAASADTATNASKLGGISPSGYVEPRWAVVQASASGAFVVRGSNVEGAALRTAVGSYVISFPSDIRQCAYLATLGNPGAGVSASGEISVEQLSPSNPSDVLVRTYNAAGAAADPVGGNGFHLAVIC